MFNVFFVKFHPTLSGEVIQVDVFFGKHGVETKQWDCILIELNRWEKDVWNMTGNENSQPRDVFCCSFNFGLTSFWFEAGLLLYLIKNSANQLSIWCWQWVFHFTMLCVFTIRKKCLNTKIPKHQQSTRWWFQIVFIFTPTWGNDPIWRSCFSNGLKPPTRSKWFP